MLTIEEIKTNNRLARCEICGEDIFYLEIDKEPRTWWHEDIKKDRHRARPGKAVEYETN